MRATPWTTSWTGRCMSFPLLLSFPPSLRSFLRDPHPVILPSFLSQQAHHSSCRCPHHCRPWPLCPYPGVSPCHFRKGRRATQPSRYLPLPSLPPSLLPSLPVSLFSIHFNVNADIQGQETHGNPHPPCLPPSLPPSLPPPRHPMRPRQHHPRHPHPPARVVSPPREGRRGVSHRPPPATYGAAPLAHQRQLSAGTEGGREGRRRSKPMLSSLCFP